MNTQYRGKLAVLTAVVAALSVQSGQAQAANITLGTVTSTISPGAAFYNDGVMSGTSTDTYTFTEGLNTTGVISGDLTSNFQYLTSTGSVNNFSSGVELTGGSLFDVTTNTTVATLNLVQTGPIAGAPVPVTIPGLGTVNLPNPYSYYGDTLSLANPVNLVAGNTYELKVNYMGGSSLTNVNTEGHYLGYVTLNVNPVPEPEQWAMLLLGMPLIGWVARKKQAASAKALLA
jgi:hypothetical protein